MTCSFVSSDIYRAAGYPGNHPLAIQRIGSVMTLCEQLGWLGGTTPAFVPSPQASLSEITAVHDADYVSALRTAEASGRVSDDVRAKYRIGTLENPVFPGVFQRASTAVGGSILAARLAAEGGVAYHPAGGTHHGMPDRASGFCYFNDPVFAIRTLLDLGRKRVLYVDLDAHHGDGVEAAFAGEDRVMLISVHEANRWPHTGALHDRSTGNARNLPVPPGMNDSEMDYLMAEAVLPLARGFAPEAVVITCGGDALRGDPLSSLALSNTCVWDAVMALVALSPSTVVLGGGGYNPWTVARLWAGLWGRIAGHAIPDSLPEASQALLRGLNCDLVDEDDMRPEWTVTLADPRHDGPVRPRFAELVAAVLAPGSTRVAA